MGVITGIRQVTRPYSLQYGAGSALDSSGSVSDSLRNLVMHHADTHTFLKFYLSRRISKNLPAIIRGLDPEEDIIRAAYRISHTIDPDRPQWLTTEQSTSINRLPEIEALINQQDKISRSLERPLSKHKGTLTYKNYRKLNRELTGAKKRTQDALLLQTQNKYDREQPILEIKRQLSGIEPVKSIRKPLECSTEVPALQQRLIKSLLTLPRATLEEEMARRTEAIDAVANYYHFEEGDTCRLPRNKRIEDRKSESQTFDEQSLESKSEGDVSQPEIYPPETPFESAFRSVMKDHRPLFYFICLGQQGLDITRRVQKFHSHADVTKHIKRKHLKKLVSNTVVTCNVCDEKFSEPIYFQRHAFNLHRTLTGPLVQLNNCAAT
ncbi:hypothetical protein N7478_012312 [Penicillium angulare]|uniref:uncharacterized protein n=1 Tax=Penicillium angulare TaxID=116970 RepID=UPI00253F8281|nr:uncharacterized protein N7478_012312 [Penicillium angulare]KAJ5259331.1 hypothetical protein N7478_012312 [Penicillium angulare]